MTTPIRTYEYAPGMFVKNVHSRKLCQGRPCVIHNPSAHEMRDLPLHWRADRVMFERICAHGVGHPDPDHLWYVKDTFGAEKAKVEGVHGCCGCCGPKHLRKPVSPAVAAGPKTPGNAMKVSPAEDAFAEALTKNLRKK